MVKRGPQGGLKHQKEKRSMDYFAGLDVSVKETSDLHYIAVGIVLVVSAGLGVLVASQIVVVLGYTG